MREVPVLIVGGGPAGLTLALWLQRSGVDPLLVERRDFSSHFPRAHLLNVRTMEVFGALGVADDIYAIAAPERGWRRVAWYTSLAGPTPLHGRRLGWVSAWGGGDDEARYAQASPRQFTNLPQLHLDRLLAKRALAAAPGRMLARHEVVGLQVDADGATAEVLDHETGGTEEVRSRYVVAADGGRTCGDLLGVRMHGARSLVDVVSLYVEMDLSRHADDEALLTYFVNPDLTASVPGTLLAIAPDPLARHSREWTISLKFQMDDPARHDVRAAVDAARRLLGLSDVDMRVKAVGRWQFEGVVAEQFRVGPVFLVGDAAHRHPPTGGLGLNTAVQDAANLGWKLAAVLRGEAPPSLLDTYEQERAPVAAFNVEHALRNAGRHAPIGAALGLRPGLPADDGWERIAAWASDTPEGERSRADVAAAVEANRADYSQLNVEAGFGYASGAVISDGSTGGLLPEDPTVFVPTARPGFHLPHAFLSRAGTAVSTVDTVALVGLTLLADADQAAAWQAAVRAVSAQLAGPLTLVLLGDATGLMDPDRGYRRLIEVSGGAVLVRPDRHVAWRVRELPADATAALLEAATTVLAGAGPAAPADATRLARITAAGEALRQGAAGDAPPRIFEEVGR